MSFDQDYRQILIETPLYTLLPAEKFNRNFEDGRTVNIINGLRRSHIQFDCYCTKCERPSTFVRTARTNTPQDRFGYKTTVGATSDTFLIQMRCTRANHEYYIWLMEVEGGVRKIGMSPSMEDIANSELEKYRGILDKAQYSELHRASGLASHGIGIGSFVYLRRIFEKQIADHYQRRVEERGVIDGFDTMRVAEKIEAIKEYLPEALVKHRKMYGILSKGIHELDERMCRDFFPPLRHAILMILEQDHQIKERMKVERALEKSLEKIAAALPKE